MGKTSGFFIMHNAECRMMDGFWLQDD